MGEEKGWGKPEYAKCVHTIYRFFSFILLNQSASLPLKPLPWPIPPNRIIILGQKLNRASLREKVTKIFLNGSLFINLMQVYKIYCTLPNKSAMKNKIQKKTKHGKCAAISLLAIRILKNSIMYPRFSLKFKEL